MKAVTLLCVLLTGVQLSTALPQLYYTGGTYFRPPSQSSVSAEAVTVALASLLSVAPPLTVSPEVAGQVRHSASLDAVSANRSSRGSH